MSGVVTIIKLIFHLHPRASVLETKTYFIVHVWSVALGKVRDNTHSTLTTA